MKKILFAVLASAAIASYASAAAGANLGVTITGPANANVNVANNYTISVDNTGPNTSGAITLTVDLPLTNTSPQVYVLGNVSENDNRCNIVNRKIVCNLLALKKGKSTDVVFSYTAPVANKALTMKAVVVTNNETNTTNNEFFYTPNVVYPDRVITSGNVTNSHCTGTNLSAYFECLLFPSSISSHEATLNIDNTITIAEPDFSGTWSQPANNQLKMEYFVNGDKAAEFNGYAVNNGNCFEGITIFPNSTYNSAYRVCLQ